MAIRKRFDLKRAIHGDDCGCAAHRTAPSEPTTAMIEPTDAAPGTAPRVEPAGPLGWISSMVPLIACAFCPACLSVWVPALASAGLAIAWTESDHHLLLGGSVLLSIALSGWRAARTRQLLPLGLGIVGCTLLVGAHLAGESLALTIAGAAVLVTAPSIERRRLRALASSLAPAPPGSRSR